MISFSARTILRSCLKRNFSTDIKEGFELLAEAKTRARVSSRPYRTITLTEWSGGEQMDVPGGDDGFSLTAPSAEISNNAPDKRQTENGTKCSEWVLRLHLPERDDDSPLDYIYCPGRPRHDENPAINSPWGIDFYNNDPSLYDSSAATESILEHPRYPASEEAPQEPGHCSSMPRSSGADC